MAHLSAEILLKFDEWYEEAGNHKAVRENNAVNIASSDAGGRVSNRMVLLKDYDKAGFVFYTNLQSRKGRQLQANPWAALCFYWEPLSRQIRIEGKVSPVSKDEADDYFNSRPLKSRIGAWASKQSQPLDSKATLLKEVAKQGARFVTEDVPRPPHWSGFRLEPVRIEFWQAGEYRIHDRICYDWADDKSVWEKRLLYP